MLEFATGLLLVLWMSPVIVFPLIALFFVVEWVHSWFD